MRGYTNVLMALLIALTITACDSGGQSTPKNQGNANGGGTSPSVELEEYPASDLNDAQKHALAYMWHEEKLAYEIYLELNKVHPANQFVNIATKSEIVHMNLVKDLVEKYDINITNLADFTVNYSKDELLSMPVGKYAVPAVQSLYDTLYAKGIMSKKDALEVACMVEVTDVNDLDEYIEVAGDAQDLVETFKILRDGSYKHYWAFDGALKMIGVSNGCCVLGEDFCKTEQEYPNNKGH
ncbi:MAG: DUF2202 domain-containing protein [Campylobacterota bacterium]|nr:DUF2202 domain-containing protein [Campylobacterota bacterium]